MGGGAEIHLARDAAGAFVLCGDAAAVDAADHHRVYAQAVLGEAVSGEGAQVAFGVHFAFHREAADDAADIVVAADAAVVVAVGSLAVGLAVVLLVGGVVHQDIAAVLGVDKTVDSLDGGAGQGVEVAVDVVQVALEDRAVLVDILTDGRHFVGHVVNAVGDDALQIEGCVRIGHIQSADRVAHRVKI